MPALPAPSRLVAALLLSALGACATAARGAAPTAPASTPVVAPASAGTRTPAPEQAVPDGDGLVPACALTPEPVEAACDGAPCVVQRAARLTCEDLSSAAFAAHDARRAAVVVLGPSAWLVDLAPGSAQPVRHLHDEPLAWGHLVAGPGDGYRLFATALNRRAVVSAALTTDGKASASGALESIETALPIIVVGAATRASGRALAWVGHRYDASPLRRVEQAEDGGWRTTEVFPRVWGQPFVAAHEPGAYGLLFSDARVSAPRPGLIAQLGEGPARALAPWRARGATQLAVSGDGGTAWLLDDAEGVARLSVLGPKVLEVAQLQGALAGPQTCAAPAGTRADAPSYECRVSGEERSPVTLAPTHDGALWALQVVRRVERDQRVRRHFMPVDPTQAMKRVPPPHVEEQRETVADRSTGTLVVYRVARAGKGWAVEARARVAVPEQDGLTSTPAPLVLAREGVVHVLLQSPGRRPAVLRHLVLDASRLAR